MRWRLRGGLGAGISDEAELDARLSDAWEAATEAVGAVLDFDARRDALRSSSVLVLDRPADPQLLAGTGVAARRRQRLGLSAAAGTVAVLTAAAVAVAAFLVPSSRHRGVGVAGATDAADVVKRVDSAISATAPATITQIAVTPGGAVLPDGISAAPTAEEWSYGDQWRSVTDSVAGHPVYDVGLSRSSVYTVVNYQTRTWARHIESSRPAGLVPGSCRGLAALPLFKLGPPPGLHDGTFPAAAALRAAISCAPLVQAGRQRVNGVEAIKLTSRRGSPISETIWVDPSNYLPVRVVIRPGPGQPGPARTADIRWLPVTAQNLATLAVPIPAGFRQVSLQQAAIPAAHV